MPVINYGHSNATAWQADATSLWGILLHPKGELDTFNYMTEPLDSLAETRTRVIGLQSQTLAVLLTTAIFVRNFNISLRMVVLRIRTLSAWCCFIPSLLGAIFGGMVVYAFLFSGLSCRNTVWFSGFINTIAIMCNSAILLQKAYLVLCRQRWIIIFGTIFTLPQLGFFAIIVLDCYVTVEPKEGCVLYYPLYLPLYWFFASVPINLFFSAIFSHVTYQQYRTFGSEAWMYLARDGIQTMCLAVLCNFVCGVIILFGIGGNYAIMFYIADWLLSSTILINHCQNMRKASMLPNKPKTKNLINLSQIPTSNTVRSRGKPPTARSVGRISSISPLTQPSFHE
ncbi:hypothetical protein SYNPS1DRAFT_23454 [Syncephalis pseudoplumigaleata]|uniref:Uncharacterized protein n=1 Tax=Syncephalis pseudoplumigaleata TaxID=1712513 RepID=A0A4P9YWZ5_9FUNG|nr:hypothetical protein SYNPS1DRAFT_23454 [Syncephalis pseudoplumigaleata]|eukprot:RKP24464.1 hypothetical protein SYNPS1DRAFT_23454 [Syncephalis pseudoplumigaleata]